MVILTTEVFFRPDELERNQISIPAALHNRCRLFLTRCEYEHVFVPIRSMQYLAIIDEEEIIFVDSQAYAVRGDEGGRMILLAWKFRPDLRPDSINDPVPLDLVSYHADSGDIQKRLIGEFGKALDVLEERHKETGCDPRAKKVVAFNS